MSKGTNPLLIAVLVVVGYQLLKPSETEGEAGTTTTIFGGGGGTGDLSGLFQGVGDMLSGVVGGLSDMVSRVNEGGGGGALDASGFLSGIGDFFKNFTGLINLPGGNGEGGENGGGLGEGDGGGGSTSMPNTIPNILNALSDSVDSLSKGLLIGAGTYLGVKAVTPVLPAVSGVIRQGVSAVGTPVVNLAGGAVRDTTTAISTVGSWLRLPVTKVPILGTAGLSVAAFGAGWGLGELFNITPPGKALIEWSGEQGRKAVQREGWIQKVFFPFSKTIEFSPSTAQNIKSFWGVTPEQLKNMTTAQMQAVIQNRPLLPTARRGYTPTRPVSERVTAEGRRILQAQKEEYEVYAQSGYRDFFYTG